MEFKDGECPILKLPQSWLEVTFKSGLYVESMIISWCNIRLLCIHREAVLSMVPSSSVFGGQEGQFDTLSCALQQLADVL